QWVLALFATGRRTKIDDGIRVSWEIPDPAHLRVLTERRPSATPRHRSLYGFAAFAAICVDSPRRRGEACAVRSAAGRETEVHSPVTRVEPPGGDGLRPGIEVHSLGPVGVTVTEQ